MPIHCTTLHGCERSDVTISIFCWDQWAHNVRRAVPNISENAADQTRRSGQAEAHMRPRPWPCNGGDKNEYLISITSIISSYCTYVRCTCLFSITSHWCQFNSCCTNGPAQRGLVLVGTGGGVEADDTGEALAAGARISALLGGGGGGFLRCA